MTIGKLISLAAALGAAFLLLPPVQTQFYTAGIRWFYVLLVSYLVAVALTPLIRHMAVRIGTVDHPSSRKIHESSPGARCSS